MELLRRCLGSEGLWVSDISVWEIGAKAARGGLALMPSASAWIERASHRTGFSACGVGGSTL